MRTFHSIAALLLLAAGAGLRAETPFVCGEFSPSKTISTSADLGITATSMIASPGQTLLPSQLTQPGWFLIDMYGTGAVMGCQPSRSFIQGAKVPQLNRYFPDGTVKEIIATGLQSPPIKLSFVYEPGLPYRLQTAENFCMSGAGGGKVRYVFSYNKSGRLVSMQQSQDNTCPAPAAVTVTYDYTDPNVPGLPTLMTVRTSGSAPQRVSYAYQVAGGAIQGVKITPAGVAPSTIAISYTANLITKLDWAGTPLTVVYRNGNQWASMLDGRFSWGLTISYENDRVSKTLQDTGCPGACPPSTFQY